MFVKLIIETFDTINFMLNSNFDSLWNVNIYAVIKMFVIKNDYSNKLK